MKESQQRLEANPPNYGKQFIICDIMRLVVYPFNTQSTTGVCN